MVSFIFVSFVSIFGDLLYSYIYISKALSEWLRCLFLGWLIFGDPTPIYNIRSVLRVVNGIFKLNFSRIIANSNLVFSLFRLIFSKAFSISLSPSICLILQNWSFYFLLLGGGNHHLSTLNLKDSSSVFYFASFEIDFVECVEILNISFFESFRAELIY